MLKFYNYDIVFQEFPDEVTLAINITGCPNRCPNCHSQFLWEDAGDELSTENLEILLKEYGQAATCIGLMGGDQDAGEVNRLAAWIKSGYSQKKVGWYTGKKELSPEIELKNLDYVKIGPYIESKGGLNKETTNQRLYRVSEGEIVEDLTPRFWKKR